MAKVKRKTLVRARELRSELTTAERIVWSRLKRIGVLKFRRQHPIGPFIADFACIAARLVVEIDGDTHSTDEERARDARREAYIRAHGWRIIRVWNSEVYAHCDQVLDGVLGIAWERIERAKVPPPSSR